MSLVKRVLYSGQSSVAACLADLAASLGCFAFAKQYDYVLNKLSKAPSNYGEAVVGICVGGFRFVFSHGSSRNSYAVFRNDSIDDMALAYEG